MTITYYSPNEFDKLEEPWKILEKGDDMTPFQKFDWYKNINDLYFQEKTKNLFREWVYVLVSDDKRPVMILPIQVIKYGFQMLHIGLRKGFYFIGRCGYTDYLNCIYSDFSVEAFETAQQFLINKYKKRFFCLERILHDSTINNYLYNKRNVVVSECRCAALTLPGTFEEYNKMLSKSSRQNIRTAINRQAKNNIHLTHRMIYDVDDEMAARLNEIRQKRLKQKNKKGKSNATFFGKIFMTGHRIIEKLFDAKHDVIRNSCSQWCFLVEDNGQIAGYYWGIFDRGTYYVCIAGVNEDYAWYSPSISSLYLYIKELYESDSKDIKVIDFTRGGERYKEDIGGVRTSAYSFKFCEK